MTCSRRVHSGERNCCSDLTEEGGLSFIDWSGGGQGDPRHDIALALHREPEFDLGERELAAFFDGYGSAPVDTATRAWFVGVYDFF